MHVYLYIIKFLLQTSFIEIQSMTSKSLLYISDHFVPLFRFESEIRCPESYSKQVIIEYLQFKSILLGNKVYKIVISSALPAFIHQ